MGSHGSTYFQPKIQAKFYKISAQVVVTSGKNNRPCQNGKITESITRSKQLEILL
jgi:hypothetical protein